MKGPVFAVIPTQETTKTLRMKVTVQYADNEKQWEKWSRYKQTMIKTTVPYKAYGWKMIKEKGNAFMLGYIKIPAVQGQRLVDHSGVEQGIFYEEVLETMPEGAVQKPVKWIVKPREQGDLEYLEAVRKLAKERPGRIKAEKEKMATRPWIPRTRKIRNRTR